MVESVGFSLHRWVPLGLLVISGASVPILLWSPSGLARLDALRMERQRIGVEVERLEREIQRLRVQADAIKASPSSVERVARDELGLVRRTEVVIQFEAE
jgi:cell division protein FtsB